MTVTPDEILAHFDMRFEGMQDLIDMRFHVLEDTEGRNHQAALRRFDTIDSKVTATNGRVTKLELDREVDIRVRARDAHAVEKKREDESVIRRSRTSIIVAVIGLAGLLATSAIAGVVNLYLDHH